jgi:hypothetical protein
MSIIRALGRLLGVTETPAPAAAEEERREMGEVKDAVKGGGRPSPMSTAAGGDDKITTVLDDVRALANEISSLVAKKDEDTLSEGEAAKPENMRKAALLRATHALLTTVRALLEDY